MKRIIINIVSVAVIVATVLFWLAQQPHYAHAATVSNHPNFIIQNDDLQNLTAIGITDTFGFVLCNYVPPASGAGNIPAEQPCSTGQVPHFGSELQFADWAATAPHGSYAVLDLEVWDQTPANERLNIPSYTCNGAKVAVKYGIHLIATPVVSIYHMGAADAEAAKCGAWGVDEQIQYHVGQRNYRTWALSMTDQVHAANKNTKVFVGLGTDPGGTPVTARDLINAWDSVRAFVYGAWLNAPGWESGTGCATVGCPVVAEGFLNYIDQ